MAIPVVRLIEAGDHRLMRRVNRWRAPRWLRLWMLAATRGGDGWLWYLLALFVALFGGAERFQALAAAAIAAGLGIGLFLKIKRACRRKRPCAWERRCCRPTSLPFPRSTPSRPSR